MLPGVAYRFKRIICPAHEENILGCTRIEVAERLTNPQQPFSFQIVVKISAGHTAHYVTFLGSLAARHGHVTRLCPAGRKKCAIS